MKKRFSIRILASALAATLFALLCVPTYALLPDNERLPGYVMSSSYKSGSYYSKLLAVKLTGDMRKDIVAVCRSQLGYHEGGSIYSMDGTSSSEGNYTEYNNFYTAYAKYYGDDYNYINCAWCGSFVSFCMYMARIPESILHLSAQTNPQAYGILGSSKKAGAQYKSFSETVIRGGSYTPLPGDIVFFAYSAGSSSYRHIGIVESTEFSYNSSGQRVMTVNTFEGNCSNQVKNYHWSFTSDSSGRVYDSMYITGFGIPKYTTQVVAPEPDPEPVYTGFDLGAYGGSLLRSGSSGDDVIRLQFGLNLISYATDVSCSCSVLGTFDSATLSAVKAYQTARSLEVDGIVGSETFGRLRDEVNGIVDRASGDFIVNAEGRLLLYKGSSDKITLPDNCTSMGGYAFFSSKPSSLTLPAAFSTVYSNAFYKVTTLKNVIYNVSKTGAAKITVSTTGNDAFNAASKTYNVSTHTVTFHVGGDTITQVYEDGEIPSFAGSVERPADDLLYYFTGWDKPFEKVTGDAVYTAQYFTVPNTSVTALAPEQSLLDETGAIRTALTLSGLRRVSAFSFVVDFSQYADVLTFDSWSVLPDSVDGVTVTQPASGLLRFEYAGEEQNGEISFVFDFTVADSVLEDQIFIEFLSGVSGGFYVTDGERQFALPADFSRACAIVNVSRTAIYDFDGSGDLSITDVSSGLDVLGGVPAPNGQINASFSIEYISRLLDIISGL